MIILAILDTIFAVVSSILGVVLPALPAELDTYLVFAFNLMANGLEIVFKIFLERDVVIAIATWIAEAWVALFGIDLLWRVIEMIKLSHGHQEDA